MAGPLNMVGVVNRTTAPLEVVYDGAAWIIPPGYRDEDGRVVGAGANGDPLVHLVPAVIADFGKRQNPQPGTGDPDAPNDFVAKIGVPAWGDDVSYLGPAEAEELLDRSLLDDEARAAVRLETTLGRRKRRKRSRLVNPRLRNPAGIKAAYDD